MTKSELQTLKAGQKVIVSYKGERNATLKNINGACAYVYFDSGDGTGVRLHRVLATTLKLKKSPIIIKSRRYSEASSREIEEALNYKPRAKVAEPKQTLSVSEVLELVRAGYIKAEIEAMTK